MKNNNYIYAALGLLALFMIVKNQRTDTTEERQGEPAEPAESDKAKETGEVKDVLLDFQPQGFQIF
jgi:hypothetical protein